MNLPKEIFIVVCEHDGIKDGIPITWETYLDYHCSRGEAERQAKILANRYGETRIGRLVMDDEEIIDLSDAMTEEEKKNQPF